MATTRTTGLITLTTDFGTQDGYVGAMKGVLIAENANARIVDLTHEIPPQDVMAGAFALAQGARTFPPGTIHVGVVDPGVGSSRRALIVESRGSLFIGPDNGLLALAAPPPPVGEAIAWEIDRLPAEWTISPTFHGRDLFARVAARLGAGESIAEFSSRTAAALHTLAWPAPAMRGEALHGEVIHIDRFGNLVTGIADQVVTQLLDDNRRDQPLARRFFVEIGAESATAERIPLVRTYADVERGALLAYIGSAGYLEIALRDGSAAVQRKIARGVAVRVRRA